MKRIHVLSSLILALAGCASGPAVRASKDLPVRNVVLYRSGVGYFERSGSFEGKALEFAVKEHDVGDFLSSLTAVEQTSGGVRSVSFDVPDKGVKEGEKSRDRVDVRLFLAGEGRHDVQVAYVVGAPIWRPSYRVVFDDGDKALLQAWAVVQNISGEDWDNVKLSLTTGAPISFRSDLGTPIVPERPVVSDTGEVVSSVPVGEVAVAQGGGMAAPAAAPAPSMAPMEMEAQAADESLRMEAAAPMAKSARGRMAAPPAPPISAGALERNVRPEATIALAENVTRYDIAYPVNVPDGGSTMVAIVSERVPGEKAHLFAPDGGVPTSFAHPFSVVKLSNATGAVLEKGPVSVLSNGAFLGQGVLDSLPRDATAFVPFSVDKSLVVEPSESYTEEQGALVRVQRNLVTVERFSQRKTRYHVRNGSDASTKLYVRHNRWGDADLVKPPEGTELSPGKALVPMQVPAKGKSELEVIERTPVRVDFTFMDQPAADAIALYLAGPAVDAAQGPALKKALDLRAELVKLLDQVRGLEREQNELENASSETRKNIKAIEKVTTAHDLRTRLVERLKQLDQRLGDVTKQLVELRTRQSELEVRLNEALDGVSLITKG